MIAKFRIEQAQSTATAGYVGSLPEQPRRTREVGRAHLFADAVTAARVARNGGHDE